MKDSSLILLFACALIALGVANPVLNSIPDLKSLPVSQKLGLLASSILKPSNHHNFTWNSLFEEDNMAFIDHFFVDLRTLLIQTIKVTEEPILPELSWSIAYSWCFVEWCVDEIMSVSSSKTYMAGQKLITSVNSISDTTFINKFHVPNFVWHSPDFLFDVTDKIHNFQLLSRDLKLGIDNLTLITTAEYEFNLDLGVQISNLTIDFNLGYLGVNIKNNTVVYDDGRIEFYDPIETDHTEYLISNWEDINKYSYQETLQFRINCILSGSRNDPERCELDGIFQDHMYYRFNVLQLMETIGLGSLDRYTD
ncbi:unnamed protein product [Orchesella dallaii]|uniref:Uncharacterized protein n=1 Tax=Orchesella dallaii TaxID=48710 RepID=A0ABP1S7T8_9HEXA